ncbi:DUF689-domain-containing protein [Xylaria sp. CBS 124048]|nr:DUF689-domain-containing protein [Xylaria sp. CBS 124048]
MTVQRTLLLAPPSIASHEETLRNVYTTFDRASSDLTMLDRLSSDLVTLPSNTYDLVVVLKSTTTTENVDEVDEVARLLTRPVYDAVTASMKIGAILRSQEGSSLPGTEAILAGLIPKGNGTFEKAEEEAPVLLRLGGKKKNGVANGHGNNTTATANSVPVAKKQPAISLLPDDDLDAVDDDDDDLIDEDTLLTEEDMNRKFQPPAECIPKIGKRRRACKDCTCGLAAKIEAEDKARRAKADKDLNVLKLDADDLDDLELDFTVKGKVGSCGSCSLGDAFRCADCPYIGLPAFKPGEEVTLLNNVAQL